MKGDRLNPRIHGETRESRAKATCLSTTSYYEVLQLWMYEHKIHRIEDRIVSINQPHIRPIVRGKAGSSVEFGAKISASCLDGYVFLDYLSWDNFNESNYFIKQVESFKENTIGKISQKS